MGAGALGLATALSRAGGCGSEQFDAYATRHIRGAMLDELRRYDPLTRPQRREARRLEVVSQALERSLGRPAEPGEVAQAAGVSEQDYWSTLQTAQRGQLVSLEAATGGSETAVSAWPSADDGPEQTATRRLVWKRVRDKSDCLTPRERDVLGFELSADVPQSEIAAALGVTVARVSQLRASAIARLRRECGLASEIPPAVVPRREAVRPPTRKKRRVAACSENGQSRRPRMRESLAPELRHSDCLRPAAERPSLLPPI
jgi:RNA polymerase sigma factor for flagellar operon FliA